jgi:proteic killer suppression protein
MRKRYEVYLARKAQRQFEQLPNQGIESMRRIPGYHDEPLKGERFRQRSSRLSKGYRVIYREEPSGEIVVVMVLEVHKHEY